MARLLNEVDRLSDRLHEEFITITEDDYRMFGPELKIVISMYSGGYPFSVPVIPVHFFVGKTDYLLRS